MNTNANTAVPTLRDKELSIPGIIHKVFGTDEFFIFLINIGRNIIEKMQSDNQNINILITKDGMNFNPIVFLIILYLYKML